MEDTYISLGTGHAGYISGTARRKPKHPIGFTVPKRRNKPSARASDRASDQLPKRASASPTPRARVTKSTTKRKHTTRNT